MLNINTKTTQETKLFFVNFECVEVINLKFNIIRKNIERRLIKIKNYEQKRVFLKTKSLIEVLKLNERFLKLINKIFRYS